MDGEIEILDALDSGSFGQVYRGIWHRKEGYQTVAIKCFDSKMMRDKDVLAIKMVHRESLLISAIQNNAIVKVIAVQLDDHMQFIVEEYLAGGNLQNLLDERRLKTEVGQPLMSALEIINLGTQLAQALNSVHSRGIYHGDLKPSNICFRDLERQELVLVDFGHGGFYDDNILDLQLNSGTLAYLPPERTGFVKFAGNVESELYSIGALLYECCAGVPLFKTKDAQEFINLLLRQVPPPLHKICADFPEQLSDIIQKLIRKQPGQRYCSAIGLHADLERCHSALLKGEPLLSFALGTRDKLRELNYKIPIVGRQAEMSRLTQGFEQAAKGEGSIILIGAPSGTGKSRLAFELLQKAKAHDASIISVKFSDFERNLPLSALGILLLDHAHTLQTMPTADLIKWQHRLLQQLGSGGYLLTKRFAFYAPWLPEFPLIKGIEREQETRLFNQTLARFLTMLSVEDKVQVLLLDDLQWADAHSLAVVRELTSLSQEHKIGSTFLVGTYRSNEVRNGHPLDAILKTCILPQQNLLLNPLLRDESDQLITCLLDEAGPEVARLQQLAYKLTEGNPFFISEYLKAAIVSGLFAMRESDQTWHLDEDKTNSMTFHAGVANLVSERIKKLDDLPKHMMQAASIASNAITLKSLTTLLAVLEPNIATASNLDALQIIRGVQDELVQKHLVLAHDERFLYIHDKIREASLALLSPELKKKLHSCYARSLGEELLKSKKVGQDKKLFEAAWHVIQGAPEEFPQLARRILFRAALSAKYIFAYKKARDYLAHASELYGSDYHYDPEQLQEWLEVHELWADTLAVSDRVHDALKLYDKVLQHATDPLLKAEIYAKITECNLTLFRYIDCMKAAIQGLDAIGERMIVEEWKAYVSLVIQGPLFMITVLWFWMFGKQTKEIKTRAEKIRFRLLLALQVPLFFDSPIIAVANAIPVTRELLSYKTNEFRAQLLGNWGGVVNIMGFSKSAAKLFAHAFDYFDQQSDPIRRSIVLFEWSYLHDFNFGKIKEATFKFNEVCRDLAAVGESYWRSLSLQGIMHLSYYGAENIDANLIVAELKDLWKRLQYVPTMLGCTLRSYLHEGQDEQLESTMRLVREAESSMKAQGINSLDAIFARAAQGEIYQLRGDYHAADPFLADAFRFCVLKHHRIAYCLYVPILYAKNLIRQERFLRAFSVLGICWFNQAAKVRIYLPQTLFVTGEFLHALGLQRLGIRFLHRGIRVANLYGWRSIVAEGRLLMGTLLCKDSPEEAEIYLRLSQKYFKEKSWRFFEGQCEHLLVNLQLKHRVQTEVHTGLDITQTQSNGAFKIRQKMETQALLEIFLRLSSLGQQDDLLEALMESLGNCTGADLAVIFMPDGESFSPYKAMNCKLIDLQSQGYERLGIDKVFLDDCVRQGKMEPVIRSQQGNLGHGAPSGSALVLPLAYDDRIYAYCFLANQAINELFDTRTLETVQPIATQAAITLQSIRLANDLKHLNRTLEDQVDEQTREIKSILANLPLGVMVIEGHEGLLHKTYSHHLETLLQTKNLAGMRAIDILLIHTNVGADERNQIEASLNSMLGEDSVNFDLNAHLLPISLIRHDCHNNQSFWDLSWQVIINKESLVEKVLVVISDVTDLIRHQTVAQERGHELDLISEILAVPADAYTRFIKAALNFQQENERLLTDCFGDLNTAQKIFINLHTIKGAARTLRLKHLTDSLHLIEQGYADKIKNPAMLWRLDIRLKEMQSLGRVIQDYCDTAENKLGRSLTDRTHVSLTLADVWSLIAEIDLALGNLDASAKAPLSRVHERLMASIATPFPILAEQFFHGIDSLASDLGKAVPKVEIEVPSIYLNTQIEEVLRLVFLHLVRNALDHGLEKPAERHLLKKAEQGTLKLHGCIEGEHLKLRFFDDGRGLAISKLRQMGLEKALLSNEESQKAPNVAQLIFVEGFSTADQLSDISGRGVGMSAIRQQLREAGGEITLELEAESNLKADFIAFTFIISLHIPEHIATLKL